MNRIALPTLFVVLMAQAVPALAVASSPSATATIDWSSLTFTSFDLSGGANAPAFSWDSASLSGATYSAATTHPGSGWIADYQWASDFTTSLSSTATTANGQASGTRSAATLQATAASQASTVPWSAGSSSNAGYAYSTNTGTFTLTGHGIVLITVDWSLSVSGAMADTSEYSIAQSYISGSFSDSLFNTGSATSALTQYSYTAGDTALSGTFSMAVLSTGAAPTTGTFYAWAAAESYSPALAVPEPETYAMMLAGLGLVGWMARRRRT